MKKLVIIALLALTGMSAQAQTSETRKSEDFTALDVKNGIDVIFTQSDETSLKVESDSKSNLENIVTEYSRGTLKIYMREIESGKIMQAVAKVYVSAPNVSSFKAVTGASVKAAKRLTVDELNVKLATGATFNAEGQCTQKCTVKADSGSMFRGHIVTADFEGKATGGAAIKITGSAETSVIACNNGSVIAGKFLSNSTSVKTINASTAFVNAVKSIRANADNSSSITYYGEPADVNLEANTYAIKRDNLKLALN